MKMLITGGAGFIGSNLIKELLKKKIEIHVIDVKSPPSNLENLLDKLFYHKIDIRSLPDLEYLFSEFRFDGIIHLAAVSRVIWGEKEPKKCIETNVKGTQNLLQFTKVQETRPWLLFASSREVYGETNGKPITENHPKNPLNIYGMTKLEGEHMIRKYTLETGGQALIYRFSNVFGNEKDILGRVVPRFIIKSLHNQTLEIHGGKQVFDFTYISDVVNAMLKGINLLNKKRNKQETFIEDVHVVKGQGNTLFDVVDLISETLNRDLDVIITPPRKYDVEKFIGDPSKAEKLLGFKARVSTEKGVPLAVKRFQEVIGRIEDRLKSH